MLVNLNLALPQKIQAQTQNSQKIGFGTKPMYSDDFTHVVETTAEHSTLAQLVEDLKIAKELNLKGLAKVLENAIAMK